MKFIKIHFLTTTFARHDKLPATTSCAPRQVARHDKLLATTSCSPRQVARHDKLLATTSCSPRQLLTTTVAHHDNCSPRQLHTKAVTRYDSYSLRQLLTTSAPNSLSGQKIRKIRPKTDNFPPKNRLKSDRF